MVEQDHAPRVDQRQRVNIEVRFGLSGSGVRYAVFRKLLGWPFTGISVTRNSGHSIGFQNSSKVGTHTFRTERRPHFANAIQQNSVVRRIAMTDTKGEAVRTASARVDEAMIGDV